MNMVWTAPRIGMDGQSQEILWVVWVAPRLCSLNQLAWTTHRGANKRYDGPTVENNPWLGKNPAAICILSHSLQSSLPQWAVPEKPSVSLWQSKRLSESFKRRGREAWDVALQTPWPDPSEGCWHFSVSDWFLPLLTLNYKQVGAQPTQNQYTHLDMRRLLLTRKIGCFISLFFFTSLHFLIYFPFHLFSIFVICIDVHI